MCRWVVVSVFLLLSATIADAQQQYGFRIHFPDKGGTTQSLSNPTGFLSQRAIDRRTNQNIAIDSTDLPVSPTYMDSVLSLTGGKLHMTSKWFNYTVILLNDSADILAIQGKPYIQSIEYIAYYANGLHKGSKSTTGNHTTQTTGTAAYYGATFDQTRIVNGDYLHDIGRKGEGKLIAVLDEGFAGVNTGPAFDSMLSNGRLMDTYNFADAVTNVYTNGQHGTTSLSTIAGNLPGIYVGTAPHADYALYITEIIGSEQVIEMDNVVAASERADSIGADVITISLGYDRFSAPIPFSLTYADIDGKTTIAARAANTATAKGILFIASAGNEGGGSWNYILTPGDADSALTVGNVGLNKVPASNSGYGPNSAGHVKPNVCMVGQPAAIIRTTSTPSFSSGTSFATPQLAGWAACLMQSSTTLTPYQIRTAIEESAHVYNNPGAQLGYGVPNFHYALDLLNIDEQMKIPDAENRIIVTPNPFNERIKLQIYSERSEALQIVIVNAAGVLVYENSLDIDTGTQTSFIDLGEQPAGIYYFKTITESGEQKVSSLFKY